MVAHIPQTKPPVPTVMSNAKIVKDSATTVHSASYSPTPTMPSSIPMSCITQPVSPHALLHLPHSSLKVFMAVLVVCNAILALAVVQTVISLI
jgi:hypothetical protein